MSELSASAGPVRRRRADAERSIASILDAAARVLGQRPDASIEEIAKTAGISRQTVYAHFPSRDVLVSALLDRATKRIMSSLDAAELDTGSASEALVRLLEISWEAFEADPFLLNLPGPLMSPQQERDQHEPVLDRLDQLVRRGQHSGDFDPKLPVSWVLAAILALGHAAGEEVRAGRMTASQAVTVLLQGIHRLFRVEVEDEQQT